MGVSINKNLFGGTTSLSTTWDLGLTEARVMSLFGFEKRGLDIFLKCYILYTGIKYNLSAKTTTYSVRKRVFYFGTVTFEKELNGLGDEWGREDSSA